jgi:diaminopimelate decarboxylase
MGALDPRIAAAAEIAARTTPTPFYLTSETEIAAAAAHLEAAFPDPWVRSYSLKADPLPAIVSLLKNRGWGANCVSLGEINAARSAGVPNSQITLEGIGKGPEEFDAAIAAAAGGEPFRWVALESADEARTLIAAVQACEAPLSTPIRVLLRFNPSIEPGTHAGLAVGRGSSKFGSDLAEITAAARLIAADGAGIELIGIHLHAGSQLRDLREWQTAVERSLAAYSGLVSEGLIAEATHQKHGTLCVGGGEPVALDGSDDPADQARAFRAAADAAWSSAHGPVPPVRAIEPGRALVAAGTYLVARVLHVRERMEVVSGPLALPGASATNCERQVILDAGMGELIRPALYGARHPVLPLSSRDGSTRLSAVHGPICESTDALGAHELPEGIARGDLLAIMGAGAYADAMWSPYNGRPRPARLLLKVSGEVSELRARGSV